MGEQTPPSRRLTSSQKSFRTTDIDEVGDHKHLTFFEMLGNFSIGDYFKDGAVNFAWELVTQLFGLSPDRLYVTIHLDDDEAYDIWHEQDRRSTRAHLPLWRQGQLVGPGWHGRPNRTML